MTQVSKSPLSPKISKEIENSFWWILTNLQKEEEVKKFLNDFLSPTEKTMLIKRLAIAMLLLKGYTYKDIREILKVSYPTINHIQRWLAKGGRGYKMVFEKSLSQGKFGEFLQNVDNLLKDNFGVRFAVDGETEKKEDEGFKNIFSR